MDVGRVQVLAWASAALLVVGTACGGGDEETDSSPVTQSVVTNPSLTAAIDQGSSATEVSDDGPASDGGIVLGEATEAVITPSDDLYIRCATPTDDPFMDIPCPHEGVYGCAPPYEGETWDARDPCNFAPYVGPVENGLIPEDLFPPDCSDGGSGPIVMCSDE